MNGDRPALSRIATDALAAERTATPVPSAMQRARAIARIAATIEHEARLRRRRRWAGGTVAVVAAAAAAVAIFVGSRGPHRAPAQAAAPISGSAHALAGEVAVEHEGRRSPLDGAVPLAAGDRVIASADARATIALSTGTHVVVEPGGDVSVVEQDATQIYALHAGALQADVAKLHAGQRFLVRTDDAEVEVRGTSFHLAVAAPDPSCGAGTRTRLIVLEGVVVVRAGGGEVPVAAGHAWPQGCSATATVEPPPLGAAVVSPLPNAPPGAAPAKKPALASTGTPTPSELAAQNDLFARATEARNAGDVAGALAAYERYLAKYPGGALEESASVERMRLLAKLDRRRGELAAKAYLGRHPNGFARAEAERLAAEAP